MVLGPLPPQRRPPQKAKVVKGAPPPVPRTRVVLRDVVAADRAPAYDLFLVLEGSNVFAPTTTTQRVGALELFGGTGRGDDGRERSETIAFDVTEAMAKLSKTRGFNMRYLRLTIVRRAGHRRIGRARPCRPDPDAAGDRRDRAGQRRS